MKDIKTKGFRPDSCRQANRSGDSRPVVRPPCSNLALQGK
jgi:hypothetical protein